MQNLLMKKILLGFFMGLICFFGNTQVYNTDFLDGTILFQFKTNDLEVRPSESYQKDKDIYAANLHLEDYPELALIFNGLTVEKFEKPAYFTRKSAISKLNRIVISEYDQVDLIISKLGEIADIEFVEKEPIYNIDFVPNDTYHAGNNKWYHTLVGSENAWDLSQGSNNVKVAIVDNAVFCGHADLTTFDQRDVADNDNDATPPDVVTVDFGWSHGTHCAGLATADMNNGIGMASIGANVELIGVKATPDAATSSTSIWYSYNGVLWACQNGANVVSMSFGSSSSSAAMQNLINAYPDIVFLAAAGNDGNTTPMYPGAYDNVICVGSVNSNDSRSSFSNYNGATPFVDIASPGGYSFGGLISTVYSAGGNSYDYMGGTSMATPFAAGLVGLMLSENPTMSPTDVETCLISTGATINQNIGPRIDAYAAMQCVLATLTGDPIPYFFGTPLNIFEGETVTFTDNSADGGNPITNWQWSFPGGTPSAFTGQTPPAITYNTAGVYDVTLTVTNSQSTQSYTQTGYVVVNIPPYGEWIEQVSGFSAASRGINYISIVDENIVWATAYDGSGGGANVQEFTKTTDGGLNWTPGTINVQNSNLGISMIHAIDQNTAWLAAYPTGAGQTGGIWKTTNGGNTWTRQNSALYNNAASFTNVVYFWDANNGFCQGDPINGEFELYTTTNGGATWVAVPGGSIPNPLNGNEFGYTRQIEVVGDNVWFTTSLGRIYHSTDKGYTWSVYNTPVPDFGGAITSGSSANLSFGSATEGLIVEIDGTVYRSTDGGANWVTVTTTGSVFTNGLCFIEGTNTVFTTGAGTGASGSSYSEDGGTTWNLIDSEQHLYVEFINPSIGWSGWFNTNATTAGMWKWNNLSSSMTADFAASSLMACVGVGVDYTDMTTGSSPTSWLWVFEGGTPGTSTAQNPTVTYSTPGVYDVSLTVNDGSSQTTITEVDYITVIDLPATPGTISGPLSLCENESGTYSVTNDTSVVYNWTIPGTWTGTSSSNSITITADNTPGTISVTAENICGISSPSTISISISAGLPTAGFSQSGSNGTMVFTSTSTDATSWDWDFGDGGSSTDENPNYQYTANGTYTVTLIASNGCGADTITQSVTISGVGIDELNQNAVSLYPNPANEVLNITISENLIGTKFTVMDVLGNIIYSGTMGKQDEILKISRFASGVYFVKLSGTEKSYRFIKK